MINPIAHLHKQHVKPVLTAICRVYRRPFDELPLQGVGIEIGVRKGYHAEQLLKRHPAIVKLHLVDPYLPYDADPSFKRQLENQDYAHKLLKKYSSRVVWHRNTISGVITNEGISPVDFVYIDGNHDYEHVKADISASTSFLLKGGGIVGGHDFGNCEGVTRAVVEFAVGRELNVQTPDWWIKL